MLECLTHLVFLWQLLYGTVFNKAWCVSFRVCASKGAEQEGSLEQQNAVWTCVKFLGCHWEVTQSALLNALSVAVCFCKTTLICLAGCQLSESYVSHRATQCLRNEITTRINNLSKSNKDRLAHVVFLQWWFIDRLPVRWSVRLLSVVPESRKHNYA